MKLSFYEPVLYRVCGRGSDMIKQPLLCKVFKHFSCELGYIVGVNCFGNSIFREDLFKNSNGGLAGAFIFHSIFLQIKTIIAIISNLLSAGNVYLWFGINLHPERSMVLLGLREVLESLGFDCSGYRALRCYLLYILSYTLPVYCVSSLTSCFLYFLVGCIQQFKI